MYTSFIRRFILLSVVILTLGLTTKSQNYQFSNLHENFYKSNPATISDIEQYQFEICYRNQWPGNSDFVTYDGAFFMRSERLKSTVGTHVIRDVQGGGTFSYNAASVIYAYKTRISREIFLSAGLSGTYFIYQADFSNLIFSPDGQSPNIALSENSQGMSFNIGMSLSYLEKSSFGLSVNHVGLQQDISDNLISPSIAVNYKGRYPLRSSFNRSSLVLEPLFTGIIRTDYSTLLYGSRINYSNLYSGIYLRQDLSFNFDAIIILLGTSFEKIAIFYTYDINLSGAKSRFSKLAAHEVTFLYNMEYKRKSKKRGAIKCPKI